MGLFSLNMQRVSSVPCIFANSVLIHINVDTNKMTEIYIALSLFIF